MSSKSKHEKRPNVINRTTSESLRISDPDFRIPQAPANSGVRKKIQNSSSFQVTGVCMTRSDFGDDSADDLDESHTDDISRVTDNETPSFSEDSRDTDDHHDLQLPVPVVVPLPLLAEPSKEAPSHRFKVVKMPKAAPYTKGRWTCFDYEDSKVNYNAATAAAAVVTTPALNNSKEETAKKIDANDSGFPRRMTSVVDQRKIEALSAPQGFLPSSPSSSTKECRGRNEQIKRVVKDDHQPTAMSCPNIRGQKHQPPQTLEDPSAIKDKETSDILADIRIALNATQLTSDSGSATNNNNIDRKIEEALDTVKSHLMSAVHKEVDFLKTRVNTLEGRVNELETENSFLRVNYLLFKS